MYLFLPALLILYYAGLRYLLRRERERPPIATQYAPPGKMSPGEMRYLIAGNTDAKTVAAVVLHLASRGAITIKGLDNAYQLTKRTELPAGNSAEEEAVFRVLFRRKGRGKHGRAIAFRE